MSIQLSNELREQQRQIDALASTVMGLQGALIIEQTKRNELASRVAMLEGRNQQEQRDAPQVKHRVRA